MVVFEVLREHHGYPYGMVFLMVAGKDCPNDTSPLRKYINHSPTGYEYGYAGSGPAQLAAQILYEYFLIKGFSTTDAVAGASICHQEFKRAVVAAKDRKAQHWQITDLQIGKWLEETHPEIAEEVKEHAKFMFD